MSVRVLGRIVDHLPGFDRELRSELVDAVEDTERFPAVRQRTAEALSIVGLSFTLQVRSGTGDDRRETVRQGVRLAALVLAAVLTAHQAAAAGSAGMWLSTVAAAGLVIAIGAGTVWLPVVLAVILLVANAVVGPADAVVTTGAALIGVVAGTRHDQRRCRVGAMVSVVAVSVLVVICSAAPSIVGPLTAIGVTVAVVAFLPLGWFDPRYAVAACGVSAVRLFAHLVGDGVDLPLTVSLDSVSSQLIVRGVLMAWGVIAGAAVAFRALDRQVGASR